MVIEGKLNLRINDGTVLYSVGEQRRLPDEMLLGLDGSAASCGWDGESPPRVG